MESQADVATLRISANLAEQAILESIIENSKPQSLGARPHYLLTTPFRYPPLTHGSRFASRFEPSLFYGSLEKRSCVQECAYYRFLFWHDMESPPPKPIRTRHTVFDAGVDTQRCVDLRAAPYEGAQDRLRDPASYRYTQELGSRLRNIETEALLFSSARGTGNNIALYTPDSFAGNQPLAQSAWLSETDGQSAIFRGDGMTLSFEMQGFCGTGGQLLRTHGRI